MKQKLKARNHFKRKSAAVSKRKKATHGAGRSSHVVEHGSTPEEEEDAFRELLISNNPEGAVEMARSFTRRWPKSPGAWNSLGGAVWIVGDAVQEATMCFKKSIALDPANVGGWTGLFDCLLARSETRSEAMRLLQRMDSSPGLQAAIAVPGQGCEGFDRKAMLARLWNGAPTDEPIYLWLGGGAGDKFLQSRYASLLHEWCPRVIVSCGAGTAAVLRTCPGVDTVLEESEWAEDAGLRDSLWTSGRMALTRFYDTYLPQPYLFADPQNVQKWAQRVASENLKVALVWKGGISTSYGHRRDCELAAFAALAKIPGIDFFLIQKGEGVDDPAPPGLSLKRLSHLIWDWEDTAAIMANMDLTISVDSGPLHLSAALGVETWGLITTQYWSFVFGEGCLLYDSLRVFRKRYSEPWAPLMEEVAAALGVLARKHADDQLVYEIA